MYKLKIRQGQNHLEFILPELRDCCEVIEKLQSTNWETRFYVTKITEKENK